MLERKAAVLKRLRILRYQRELKRTWKRPGRVKKQAVSDFKILCGVLQKLVTGIIVCGILFLAAAGTVALVYPVTRNILLKLIL